MDITVLYPGEWDGLRVMQFVDGENLSIRFKNVMAKRGKPQQFESMAYKENEVFWSRQFCKNLQSHRQLRMFRCHYYTCVKGSDHEVRETKQLLNEHGVAAPRVFPRSAGKEGEKARKQVDIALATEMIVNAYRDNYDVAILVSGDEDFLPVMDEVARCGKMISLWSFESGLCKKLKLAADHFANLEECIWGL